MQNWHKTTWILILVLTHNHTLWGQITNRLPCGQDFFEQSWEIPSPTSLDEKNDHSSVQRSQLVIPIVIHVVWNKYAENISDELISTQIDALNRDFNAQNQDLNRVPNEFKSRVSNIGVSFCLASKSPSGLPTNGIVRVETNIEDIGIKDFLFFDSTGGSNAWDTEKYLNIWVANTGAFLSGYGTYPGLTAPEKTGVVVNPKYFGVNKHPKYGLGRTLVHEVGHYFGLNHVWANDPLCEEDDGVTDTPKQEYEHIGCPNYPQASCTESDMFMNFMDYVDDPCMLMFTAGQKERIWANIYVFRPTLLSNTIDYYCLRDNQSSDVTFSISPNPLTDVMTITFPNPDNGLVRVQVFDMLGRLRKNDSILADSRLEMRVEDLDSGVYLVKIGRNTKVVVKI